MENLGEVRVKAETADLGRATRANVYFEPELYVLVQQLAEGQGKSFSTYVRGVVLNDMLSKNQVPGDMIMRLLKASAS